jgi:3',5'-cyclic AMP phosphodiesterase CpdA
MTRRLLRPEVSMLTILHGSDLHFGKAFDPGVADVFRAAVKEVDPDLLVLSGDFTQRAKVREYQEAKEYLGTLPDVPTVVTPGNHDVPLYRVWERLFAPLRNYRQYISQELDKVTVIDGAVVVALNSTAPHRAIVNGYLQDRQLLFAGEALRNGPADAVKIVVIHHHLAPAPDYESDQLLTGYQRCLDAFEKMGVELILGGHLHRSYVADSRDVRFGNPPRDSARNSAVDPGRGGIVIAHAGTTTSRRGRAREKKKNSFNLIRISGDWMEIVHRLFHTREGEFLPVAKHIFPRRGRGFLASDTVTLDQGEKAGDEPRRAQKESEE